jgi:two-component system NtrC family sensor kinase
MIATALDCIIVIDDAGLVIEFNPAAERTFGYSRAEAIGKPMAELVIPPALRARHAAGIARFLETNEARLIGQRIEIDGMRADGSVFPVELAIAEIRLPGRRIFSAYLRDLTPAREARAEIERQREALLQSEKMAAYGSLLAGVAHELNNPLSIVLGHALMLKEATSGTAYADRADKIGLAAERCARIVRSFLAMARQQELQTRPIDLADVVTDVLALLAYDLRSSGVDAECDFPPGLPMVLGDPDRLHQVLANLVTNARQALETTPAPRRIALSARREGDTVELSVADNGPGVPARIRSRLFDPFFTTKAVGSGTGIGLAVSRGIVESHGGSLTLAADGGAGARFVVRLPVATTEDSRPSTALPPELSVTVMPPARRRILVIDDEPAVAGLLSEIAATQGFECTIALSGSQARAQMTAQDFEAVLCDVRMPDDDGLAMHAWMAANRPALLSRLAFVTGDTLSQGAGGAVARLGRPVLEKPFMPSDVHRLLHQLSSEDRTGYSQPPL